jgi:hypothetical protein
VVPALQDLNRLAGDLTHADGVRASVETLVHRAGFELAGPPRVLWTSVRDDLPDPFADPQGAPAPLRTGRLVLLAAPSVRSTWFVCIGYYIPSGEFSASSPIEVLEVDSDPAAEGSLVAAQVSWTPAATSVMLLRPDGAVVAQAPVVDGVAVIRPPDELTSDANGFPSIIDGMRVVSLDAAGAVTGAMDIQGPFANRHQLYDWE